jgi:hypothetical protein
MITVKLKGGMGNQLFQWALGRALRERGLEVQYDLAWFENGPRPYALGLWTIDVEGGEAKPGTPIYHEQGLRYQSIPAFGFMRDLTGTPNMVLDGHWQCERYFAHIADKIRAELRPRYYPIEISTSAHRSAEQIFRLTNSCFVHVRRATHPTADYPDVHGVLPLDYYSKAIWMLPGNPELFLFCDDPHWKRIASRELESKEFAGMQIVEGNDAVTDLFLMSLCKHGIIANSSYSWWAAWLGPDARGGKVIAPRQWFAPTSHNDATDIVPDRWIKI